jgi:diguanylate cyclase (GGDEF)-like protein
MLIPSLLRRWLSLLAGCVLAWPLLLGVARAQAASDLKPVVVQLNWLHQFEFAAFYAAKEQGLYAQAGLAVELLEGRPGLDVVQEVMKGQADFGVGNSSLLLDRRQGTPVLALAALVQHSPIGLLARRDAGIQSVKDLVGKTVMVPASAFDEIRAYLQASGVDPNRVNYLPMNSPDISHRLDRAQATEIYLSNEAFRVKDQPDRYLIMNPREVGLEFYGNVLFTSGALQQRDPDLVQKFRQATLQGLRYAMSHPETLVDLILATYNTQGKSREHLLFEANALKTLNDENLVDPGYMSQNRWGLIAKTYAQLGLLNSDDVPQDFLYKSTEVDRALQRMLWILAGAGGVMVLVLGVGAYVMRLNSRLHASVAALNQANVELARLAQYDALTSIPNRRLLHERLQQSIKLAQRHNKQLAVLLIDVNRFKAINDQHGHDAGDMVLRQVARRLHDGIRQTDTAARMGGDEFVVLLSEVDSPDSAMNVAGHLRQRVAVPMVEGGLSLEVSISIGVAVFPDHGQDIDSLIKAADMAMYHGKHVQGDHVCMAEAAPAPGLSR